MNEAILKSALSRSPRSVYLIAEMACSHDGNPDLAIKIIDGAGQSGADAIQFQVWGVDEMVVPSHPDREKLKSLEFSQDQWVSLAQYVKRHYPSLEIITCIYGAKSLGFCETIGVSAYKIHAGDLTNEDLLKKAASTGKRLDLCMGASTISEISTLR